MKNSSPLRYPGGKWRIFPFFERLIELNDLEGAAYAEPFAGGGSLALSLLYEGVVSAIYLNDIDPAVHAFWESVVGTNREFLEVFDRTPISALEWERQKAIYRSGSSDKLVLGFAAFYLNRTNYSGIMNGGIIGGKEQRGDWKIDARYNRTRLREQIERVGSYSGQIKVSGEDAVDFLSSGVLPEESLTYFDPPYFQKGRRLYHNAYVAEDHRAVSEAIFRLQSPWVVSYDDVGFIRGLYRYARARNVSLLHTARRAHQASEVLFFSPGIMIPSSIL